SYNVELKSLDTSNFYSICRRMVEQMRKQPPILIEGAQIDEGNYEKLIFQSITYEYNQHDFWDIFNHDFFEYGIKENVLFPIGMGRINSFITEDQKVIQVGEREYKVDTKIEIKSTQTNLFIEDCLQINLIKDNNSINFKVFDFKSVYSQLKTLPLLIDLLKSKKLNIDYNLCYELSLEEDFSELIHQLESQLDLVQKLDKVFKKLGINNRVSISDNNKLTKQIYLLINVMLNKDYSHLKIEHPENPCFIKIELDEVYIILFYSPGDLKQVKNPFTKYILSYTLAVVVHDSSEQEIISPYLMFEKDTLIKEQNLNFDYMVDSFSLIENPENDTVFTVANDFILNCLSAYDLTENTEYLRLVYALVDIYDRQKLDPDKQNILVVNKIQAKHRDKSLNSDDYKILKDIKRNIDENELEFCINVLLESKKTSYKKSR